MSVQVIEVIGITGPEFVKTPRGGYNQLEVAYKVNGKVSGKKLVDFNTADAPKNKEVFAAARQFKSGDKVAIQQEKVGDFWQWRGVGPADEAAQQANAETESSEGSASAGSEKPSQGTGTRGKVTGSNYETSDERALRRAFDQLKHRQIGRQGCINSAIAYMNANFKEVTVEDILDTAEKFRAWSFQQDE